MSTVQIAAVARNPGPQAYFEVLQDYPVPEITPDQVLVRLDVAGLW